MKKPEINKEFFTQKHVQISIIAVLALIIITVSIFSLGENTSKKTPQPLASHTNTPTQTSETPTSTPTEQKNTCSDEKNCQYSEDIIYTRARTAAQKIADAQNAYATIDPADAEKIEKNARIMDKYLTGSSSYQITEEGKRKQGTMRDSWIAPETLKKLGASWSLVEDNPTNKNNALAERTITLILRNPQGTIYAQAYLGWGSDNSKDNPEKIQTQGKYADEENMQYLDNEYVSFSSYTIVFTKENENIQ